MDLISVILPSRGRPQSLARAVASLRGGAVGVEIIVGLDDDDPTAQEAIGLVGDRAQVVVGHRARTIHELDNRLAEQANGKWLVVFTDDYTVDQADWADRLKPTLAELPNDLGVAYFQDALYPNFATLPIVSREMVKLNGFFMPPFFPFLFGDTWWNEIGDLTGIKRKADVSVTLCRETGNDHRYRDLSLWVQMFKRTRTLRTDVAIQVLERVFSANDGARNHLIATMPERVEACERFMAHQESDAWVSRCEAMGEFPASERYADIKTRAESFLSQAA